MSPSIQGADADQLDRLAVMFQEKAQQLDNLGNQVRRAVNQVRWEGGGWGRFRSEWDQQHHKRLRVASQGLRHASDQLRAQAQDQRRVSGGGASTQGRGPGAALGTAGNPMVVETSAFGSNYEDLAVVVGALNGAKGLLDLARQAKGGPGPLELLAVPFDTIDVVTALQNGDPAGAVPGASSLALMGMSAGVAQMAAAGMVMTVAAPAVAIAGVGASVINTVFQPEHTVNSYVERTYGGVDHMSPQQAAEFSQRYNGWSGFGHAIADGVHGFARTTGGNIKNPWNRFLR